MNAIWLFRLFHPFRDAEVGVPYFWSKICRGFIRLTFSSYAKCGRIFTTAPIHRESQIIHPTADSIVVRTLVGSVVDPDPCIHFGRFGNTENDPQK
jgi:hypothetical protein